MENIKKIFKNKKTILPIIILFIFLTSTLFYFIVSSLITNKKLSDIPTININGSASNVILFIGDGMGYEHINSTKDSYNLDNLFMETLNITGSVSTFSLDGITDSAASATAMATGKKVNNSNISMYNNENLQTITEHAKSIGKAVGVLTTDYLYGATPGAFSGHSDSRNNHDKITNTQISSNIDLFMGLGVSYYSDYTDQLSNAGYSYVNDLNDSYLNYNKLFCALNEFGNTTGTSTTPTLADITNFAINYLSSKSDNGYFLMVEGAQIDKRSHKSDFIGMSKELIEFDNAINEVYNNINLSDTFMLVTADHETGVIKQDSNSDYIFTSSSHTINDVPFFAYGNVENIPNNIDNTNVYDIIKQLF